jgi:DNA-directed RNA polymerase specialized sigma subunit
MGKKRVDDNLSRVGDAIMAEILPGRPRLSDDELEDLVSVGTIGLLKGVAEGAPDESLVFYIKTEINRYLEERRRRECIQSNATAAGK